MTSHPRRHAPLHKGPRNSSGLHSAPSAVLYQAPSDLPSLLEFAAYASTSDMHATRLREENAELRRLYHRVALETQCLRSILLNLLQMRQRDATACSVLGKRARE